MLKINKINVNIGLIEILKDVSLDLEKGQMVGLIGRNGAGKTTLLRAIMGILPIKSGELIFEENDLKKEGVTTLIAESNASHYEGMLDKSFIIERGEIN